MLSPFCGRFFALKILRTAYWRKISTVGLLTSADCVFSCCFVYVIWGCLLENTTGLSVFIVSSYNTNVFLGTVCYSIYFGSKQATCGHHTRAFQINIAVLLIIAFFGGGLSRAPIITIPAPPTLVAA